VPKELILISIIKLNYVKLDFLYLFLLFDEVFGTNDACVKESTAAGLSNV